MGGGVGRVGGVVVAVVARLRIRSYLQTAFEPLAALVTLSLISHTPVASGLLHLRCVVRENGRPGSGSGVTDTPRSRRLVAHRRKEESHLAAG